jgi:N-acetylglucosaminyl-diphospho-decaprenol L-rhamnosyltransferase
LGEASLDMVIVSYQCRDLLLDCLASLRAHPLGVPTQVVVVDNGSTDGTIEMVRKDFPDVELIPSSENLGFSRANNLGIRSGDGQYVLVLNPDTRVLDDSLGTLLALMEERTEIAVCGCRLELEDGSFDHAAKRSFPTPLGALAHFSGVGRRANAPARLAQYRAPEVKAGPVDAVNGAFMLIRRAALDEVGLFDEGYWMYMEDLDLCYRFARSGWVVWYEPRATVMHVKAGSSGSPRNPRLNYAFHYGMLRFYRKHYAGHRNPALNAAVYLGIATKFVASIVWASLIRGVRYGRGSA